MKKIQIAFILYFALFGKTTSYSQTTIVLQPDESSSKDASIWNITPGTNNGNDQDFIATAWTNSGNLSIVRALIEFDLSSIPPNSTIQNAKLSFYYHSSINNIGHSQLSGSNACWLQRITDPWDEMAVTWNNQPSVTIQNEVNIPVSLNDTMSYPNIDVTNLVSDMYNSPSTSHGFRLSLQTEAYYRSLLFASSGEATPNKRPKLTITYASNSSVIDTCITIMPETGKGKNASIWNIHPSTNYGYDPDFIATAWTNSGNLSIVRGLIDFDLNSNLPANAIITSATLSLYHHASSANIGHSSLSGPNDAWLRKITSSWSENTVTWNNQPTYSTQDQVYLPATTSNTMSYPSIDVTNLITDMWNNPGSCFGMLFMLNTEINYRSMLFASNNNIDTSVVPKLRICYQLNSSVPKAEIKNDFSSIYPNPANQQVSIDYWIKANSNVLIGFYSISGKLIDEINLGNETQGQHNLKYIFDSEIYPAGIYVVKIITNDIIYTNKIIRID